MGFCDTQKRYCTCSIKCSLREIKSDAVEEPRECDAVVRGHLVEQRPLLLIVSRTRKCHSKYTAVIITMRRRTWLSRSSPSIQRSVTKSGFAPKSKARPVWYGRPARPRRLIGRGWPHLGAAPGNLWRWQKPARRHSGRNNTLTREPLSTWMGLWSRPLWSRPLGLRL